MKRQLKELKESIDLIILDLEVTKIKIREINNIEMDEPGQKKSPAEKAEQESGVN